LRTRIFVTPILVYFASLLVISMVMVPPMAPLARAASLGVIGCAGIAYVLHIAHLSRTEVKTNEQEFVWDVILPPLSYVVTVVAAAALEASFANTFNAIGVVTLLITALRKSWIVTLVIAERGKGRHR
jgi:hypothetical protein